jgi:hypothetical protein
MVDLTLEIATSAQKRSVMYRTIKEIKSSLSYNIVQEFIALEITLQSSDI